MKYVHEKDRKKRLVCPECDTCPANPVPKKERFYNFKKCLKCGRSMCKDRTLDADAWLILFYGDRNCEHTFKSVTRKEASVYV